MGSNKHYKWILEEDFVVEIPDKFKLPNFKNEFIEVTENKLIIFKGYAWDGCSPKRKIFGILVGTWDGRFDKNTGKQKCYYSSLVHDALCQFKIGNRKTIDDIFLWMMTGFIFKRIYYNSVRLYAIAKGKK